MSSSPPGSSPLPRLVTFIACLAIAGTALAGVLCIAGVQQQAHPVQPQNMDECWRLTSYAQVQKESCENMVASMQGGCDAMKTSRDRTCAMSTECTEQWQHYETYGGWVAPKPTCNREALQQECAQLPAEIARCIDSAAARFTYCQDEHAKNLAAAEAGCRSA